MKRYLPSFMATFSCVALLAMGILSLPEPAQAQFGLFIPHFGPMPFGGGGGYGGRRNYGRGGGGGGGDSDDNNSRQDRNDRPASLAPPSSKEQNFLLHEVALLNPDELGLASADGGTNKAVMPLGKAISKEADRDWTELVKTILDDISHKQDKHVTTAGDVTQHAIEQSLDKAIRDSKLDTFASFLGENWTTEELRAAVLRLVDADLDSLFNGNSRGYAPMQELDQLIQHAAQATYRRLFELSELMAANRGSALFVQRLYQTHGSHADDQLRENATDMITRTANAAVGKFEIALRQNENGYALRYRAERIVFDCLSDNVEKISSSETDIAEKGEIAQRVDATVKTECVGWIETQFGGDARAIKPQTPLPLRAVWSANGPNTDPSMFGTAAGELR
ncbi:MAG: hypothetical protein WBW06_25225 [Xanthobacteraceae bacterium]|jgi:hypothetical protein